MCRSGPSVLSRANKIRIPAENRTLTLNKLSGLAQMKINLVPSNEAVVAGRRAKKTASQNHAFSSSCGVVLGSLLIVLKLIVYPRLNGRKKYPLFLGGMAPTGAAPAMFFMNLQFRGAPGLFRHCALFELRASEMS
jgi:hypothetical protein